LKGIGIFGVVLLIIVTLVTAGCISGDYSTKSNETSAPNENITIPTEVLSENQIFEKVDYDISSVRSLYWLQSNYDTVTVKPEIFKKTAANGLVNLKLLDEEIEIEMHEVPIPGGAEKMVVDNGPTVYVSDPPRVSIFEGKVAGATNSNVWFLVTVDTINGKISIDKNVYHIHPTKQVYGGDGIHVIYRSEYQTGELNFTVVPEKIKVEEGENFKIYLTLTNDGNNTINVWKMHEQISYNIAFMSLEHDHDVPYECGVYSREPLTNNDIVKLAPDRSINDTFNSKCWSLKKGKYILSAEYHTSTGERISDPYWLGKIQSNNVTIVVE
jgi:hypothetical protein